MASDGVRGVGQPLGDGPTIEKQACQAATALNLMALDSLNKRNR